LYKELLAAALEEQKDVKIVSGHLNPDFYSDLTQIAEELLKKQKIEVIVLDTNFRIDGNIFAEMVRSSGNDRILVNKNSELTKAPHFILIGEDKYRFETDHKNTKAIASFNDRRFGLFLFDTFENLKKDIAKEVTREENKEIAYA